MRNIDGRLSQESNTGQEEIRLVSPVPCGTNLKLIFLLMSVNILIYVFVALPFNFASH